jgi:antirestriction protein ArdC
MGGQVRKGETGVPILVPFKRVKKEKDSVTGEEKITGGYVSFSVKTVFNVSQIDGLNLPTAQEEAGEAKTPLEAQDFVVERYTKSMEAKGLKAPEVTYTYVGNYGGHSKSPNWSPSSDIITLPTKEQFNSPEEMFNTISHELAHSTGHPSRLDRSELTKDYGTDDAARGKEELIAEVSAAILSSMFGVDSNIDNSAAYVKSWLKALQDDPNMIISAAQESQKVVDYILGSDLGDWSPVDGYSSAPESGGSKPESEASPVAQGPIDLDLKFEQNADFIDTIATSVSGKKYDLSALKNKKAAETDKKDFNNNLKALAAKARSLYQDTDIKTLRSGPFEIKYTPPVRGSNSDDRNYRAVRPTEAATNLKETVVNTGKAVLARAAEIYGKKIEEIEKMPDTEGAAIPSARILKGQLEGLTLSLYGSTFSSEELGSTSSYWNDKDDDRYIRESRSWGGEAWEEDDKYKESAKVWLKRRGLSYSKLKQAGITEAQLHRIIAKQIIAKKVERLEKNPDGSYLKGEDGLVVKTIIDNPYNAFWNETITIEDPERKISRVDYFVERLKEISDKYDELKTSKVAKKEERSESKEYRLATAERDSIVEAMKEAGVEFDSVALEEFGDNMGYSPNNDYRQANPISSVKSDAYRSITEAFEYIPKKTLEDLVIQLKRKKLRIKTGVARGHFTESSKGYYEITLSEHGSTPTEERYTDTAIHEFFHLFQSVDEKLRVLEHSWLFDRVKVSDENGNEIIPAPLAIKKSHDGFRQVKSGETARNTELFIPGPASHYYTAKIYNYINDEVTLSPYDDASEVMTTGVQMFTKPGKYTTGSKKIAVVKSGKSIKLLKDGQTAYYNPADGQWYKDAAFSIKIPSNVVLTQMGYDGVDEDFKSFVIGTMIGMS